MDNEHLKNHNLTNGTCFHAVYIPHENNELLDNNTKSNYTSDIYFLTYYVIKVGSIIFIYFR